MTDDQPTAEQAREYAAYWAGQAEQLTGAEQAEARRSADYWAAQATELEAPVVATPTPAPSFAPPTTAPISYPAPTVAPAVQPPVAAAPTGPRPKLLTRGVWITIGAVGFAFLVVVIGGSVLIAQRQAALDAIQGPSAADVAGNYIDALMTRDAPLVESLRAPEFAVGFGTGDLDNLIVGDAGAATSVGLEVDYEVVQEEFTDYVGPVVKLDEATDAVLMVKLSYTLQAEGAPVTAWGLQTIQLQREMYDEASGALLDGPRPDSDGPTVPGAWRVSGFGAIEDLPGVYEVADLGGSNYVAEASSSKYPLCSSPSLILSQIEEAALSNNILLAECFAGGAAFSTIEPGAVTFLAENLVPSDGANRTDLTGLTEWIVDDTFVGVPFAEYAVTAGDREFVFTIVRIDPEVAAAQDSFGEGDPFAYRVVSVVERTAE